MYISLVSLPADLGHALIAEQKYSMVFSCYPCSVFIVKFELIQYNMQHINRFSPNVTFTP